MQVGADSCSDSPDLTPTSSISQRSADGAMCNQPAGSAVFGETSEVSVVKAFSGATVFITGATGFVGSVVVEKMLRLCPDVKRIYLLTRVKAGRSGEERLELLLRKPLFHLHWKDGALPLDVRSKLVVIPGDISAPGLGLSAEDDARVTAETDYIVHSAASISFFEHVHTLLSQNYEATKTVVGVAERCQQLRGFVHVSTAYVNCNVARGSHIEEAVYPLVTRDGRTLHHAALAEQLGALPADAAEKQAQAILRTLDLPNSYTLTKHMAEDLLADRHTAGAFKVSIVRPSIVGAIAAAPLPGYFGNTAGVTAAALAFATGMAQFTCHNPNNVYDIIPCDVVGSVIMGAAAALHQADVGRSALVLHAASSTTNPCIYINVMRDTVHPYWVRDPPPASARLTTKPYKSMDHPTAILPEKSLLFQALTAGYDIKYKAMALALKAKGEKRTAHTLSNGWRIWKLYNTSRMDFHLFFCSRHVRALQALLPKAEAVDFCQVWLEGRDDWNAYMVTHMDAIRAKFFAPKATAVPAAAAMAPGPATATAASATVSLAANAVTMSSVDGTAPVEPTAVQLQQAAAVNPCQCKAKKCCTKCQARCRAKARGTRRLLAGLGCAVGSPVKA